MWTKLPPIKLAELRRRSNALDNLILGQRPTVVGSHVLKVAFALQHPSDAPADLPALEPSAVHEAVGLRRVGLAGKPEPPDISAEVLVRLQRGARGPVGIGPINPPREQNVSVVEKKNTWETLTLL